MIPELEILPAGPELRPVLENLMHLYIYDFSEFTADDTDEQGRFTDEYLPRYWSEAGRYPFLARVAGKWAGFVLVRQVSAAGESPVTHSIAEFFVMRKYRRRRIGQQLAWLIFDRFPGRWQVAQVPENQPAQQFWRRIIAEYTTGQYQEVQLPDWEGPVQVFLSRRG